MPAEQQVKREKEESKKSPGFSEEETYEGPDIGRGRVLLPEVSLP